MERYALTKVRPQLYALLEDCYAKEKLPDKACNAQERGVAERDPQSVFRRVGSVQTASIRYSDGNADMLWVVHSGDMLDVDEPNLPLAVALLQGLKQNSDADRLLRILTDESVVVYDEYILYISVLRARQNSAQYPLLRLEIDEEFCTSPELLSILSLTTTLTSLTLQAYMPSEVVNAAAPLLQAIPSLREVELDRFAGELALRVLRTRTNWSCIHLPR
jgi:hypothetical protein